QPGCDATAVHAAPLGGFMLGPGGTQPVTISCSPHPASMQRCTYRVLSPTDAVLAEFEAVCEYATAATLSPDTTAIDFGTVAVGGASSRTIALRNTGTAAIDKLFLQTTDLAGNFEVAAPCNPDARECDAGIPALPGGSTTPIVVGCTPRTVGPHSAALYISSSTGTRLAGPIGLTCNASSASAPVISVL